MDGMINRVEVFSATKASERRDLGATVTNFLREHEDLQIVDKIVTQSSDNEFHCLSITLFFHDANRRERRRSRG